MSLPIAHDILILVACARKLAAFAVQIAEPEMRERERIVQINRPPQGLLRIVVLPAARSDHTQQQVRSGLEIGHLQYRFGLSNGIVETAAVHVQTPKKQESRHECGTCANESVSADSAAPQFPARKAARATS